jgi:hypothetical protein
MYTNPKLNYPTELVLADNFKLNPFGCGSMNLSVSIGPIHVFIILRSVDCGKVEFGTCRAIDSSFAQGQVCPSLKFDIDSIEVWGCGGSQAELEQMQSRSRQGIHFHL